MIKTICALLFFLIDGTSHAGEYGITIVNQSAAGCTLSSITESMPSMTPETYADELRRYFLKDSVAIRSFWATAYSRRIAYCGNPSTDTVRNILIEVIRSSSVFKEDELPFFVRAFNNEKLKLDLEKMSKSKLESGLTRKRTNEILNRLKRK